MNIKIPTGRYKIYHIPGIKIGCTTNIQKRVIETQGYKEGEYEILFETNDIVEASEAEKHYKKILVIKLIDNYIKIYLKNQTK